MLTPPLSWLEIDAAACAHNIAQYKKAIGERILAPVIKSNAYGHGLVEIAQLCEKNKNIDWLCVVKLSEALVLRRNGITKPLLILGFIDEDPVLSLNQQIEYACSDIETAQDLNTIGKKAHSILNIHLKIDTGLARFGCRPECALSLIEKIRQLPFIRITGIWSHCAESHKADQPFTRSQIQQFEFLVQALNKYQLSIPLIHMGNSAATTTQDLAFCNFFRVGLGIYGYWSSPATQTITQRLFPDFTLKPIVQWKTRIAHIKKVPAGSSIGYDRTATAQQDTTIALLPLGYDDGYSPFLSNKAHVTIGALHAPVIGRIAMNVVTIDISHIPDTYVGQEVILLGNNPVCNAQVLAHHTDIHNPRYITTAIKSTIPRIIVNEHTLNTQTNTQTNTQANTQADYTDTPTCFGQQQSY